MNRTERTMIHDALAEAEAEYSHDPTDARLHALYGMKYVACLLGMPEGRSDYDWSTGGPPQDRSVRRRAVLRRLGRGR